MAKNSKLFSDADLDRIEIIFDRINGVHPSLKSLVNIESNCEYLLDSVLDVSDEHLLLFLNMHPFVLVQEKGRYYCLANIRLFRAAKICLDPKSTINCLLLKGNLADEIEKFAVADFYLSHLLFSLRPIDSGDQLCRVWPQLDDVKKKIMPKARQLKSFSDLLNISRKQGYKKRKKQAEVESRSKVP